MIMTNIEFGERLASLRVLRNKSAREMSFALGQSASYINSIENGKAFPSMPIFFKICDYLDITPYDFFDTNATDPVLINRLKANAGILKSDDLRILVRLTDLIISGR